MYQPPHEVRDQAKLDGMIEVLRCGGALPDVLVCGEIALTGSHRLAAYEALGMRPAVIEVSNDDLARAMEACGLDPMYDSITDFERIEQALVSMGY